MKNSTLLILIVLAAVIGVAAFITYSNRSVESTTDERTLLFPDLVSRLHDATRIEVVSPEETLLIALNDETWGMTSKGGYPVRAERVGELLNGLGQATLVEKKTAKPDKYDQIGVGEPEDGASGGTRVTVYAPDDEPIASIILGDEQFAGRQARRFVRKIDEAQSWLAEGTPSIDTNATNWIDREVLRIPRNRVQHVMIHHSDGECLSLFREADDQTNFTVEDVPEGRELIRENIGNQPAQALSYIGLEDVAPASDIQFKEASTVLSEYHTFDGLIVEVESDEIDGTAWIKVEAKEADRDADEDEEAATQPAGEEAESDDAVDDEHDLAAEIEELNKRFNGWAFAVSEAKGNDLRKRITELLKDAPSEAESETSTD